VDEVIDCITGITDASIWRPRSGNADGLLGR